MFREVEISKQWRDGMEWYFIEWTLIWVRYLYEGSKNRLCYA